MEQKVLGVLTGLLIVVGLHDVRLWILDAWGWVQLRSRECVGTQKS